MKEIENHFHFHLELPERTCRLTCVRATADAGQRFLTSSLVCKPRKVQETFRGFAFLWIVGFENHSQYVTLVTMMQARSFVACCPKPSQGVFMGRLNQSHTAPPRTPKRSGAPPRRAVVPWREVCQTAPASGGRILANATLAHPLLEESVVLVRMTFGDGVTRLVPIPRHRLADLLSLDLESSDHG